MYQRSATGSFTIYGVMDPSTHRYVYVGQTADYEERKRSLLRKSERKVPARAAQSIRRWIHEASERGLVPVFVVLETVQTWHQSFRAEADWVRRLTLEHHPLLNRWHSQQPARDDVDSQASDGRPAPIKLRQDLEGDASEVGFPQESEQSPSSRPYAGPSSDKPANHGKPWTPALLDELSRYFNAGVQVTQIASAMARTQMSIVLKLIQLGLLAEYPGHEPTASVSPMQGEGSCRRGEVPPAPKANAGEIWTIALDRKVAELYANGAGASEIAVTMGRTRGAILSRLQRLDLIKGSKNPKSSVWQASRLDAPAGSLSDKRVPEPARSSWSRQPSQPGATPS